MTTRHGFRPLLAFILLASVSGFCGVKYSANPNHRELVRKALELAVQAGFRESSVSLQNLTDRLEAGAYSEDYDGIPGVPGEHFPNPWDNGPQFDLSGLIPGTRIPYGGLVDLAFSSSGFKRGLAHGYDPIKGFSWPDAVSTTVDWASSPSNGFSWDQALALYSKKNYQEAYECLGHLLHLLTDLSIPAHVKVVNHGMVLASKYNGTYKPDIVSLIIDEYELALSGGFTLSSLASVVPNILPEFRAALQNARSDSIPRFGSWKTYFEELAIRTYNNQRVNQYYIAPAGEGLFGQYADGTGGVVEPQRITGLTCLGIIDGRATQVIPYTTARIPGGSIIPEDAMKGLCDDLVPAAAEYAAGLLLTFNLTTTVDVVPPAEIPGHLILEQNYPNPFNPSTTIKYTVGGVRGQGPGARKTMIVVYDLLGREVATLVNEEKAPGTHEVQFNGTGLPSGGYFCRLTTVGFAQTRTMMLVK
jgi:hypothetical protein